MGTENRIVPLGGGYLELMAVADPAEAAESELGRTVQGRLAKDGVAGGPNSARAVSAPSRPAFVRADGCMALHAPPARGPGSVDRRHDVGGRARRAPRGAGAQGRSPSITSPEDGATYSTSATVPLTASAGDPDGTIASVEFFDGSSLIARDTTAPYSFSWARPGSGNHRLTARATDNRGARTTSAPVTISVRRKFLVF